jgi:hypothetical protein
MSNKHWFVLYGYYFDTIQKLGEFPIHKTITLDDLKPSRGVVQAGYKEMKAYGFMGSLIDYLCYVSANYLLELAEVSRMDITDFIDDKENFSKYKNEIHCLLRLVNKNPMLLFKEDQVNSYLKIAKKWFFLFHQSYREKPFA